MFRHLADHFRETLDRHGLSFGLPTIGGSVLADIHAQGGAVLPALGIVVGILCSIASVAIRLANSIDYHRTNRALRRAATDRPLPPPGDGHEGREGRGQGVPRPGGPAVG